MPDPAILEANTIANNQANYGATRSTPTAVPATLPFSSINNASPITPPAIPNSAASLNALVASTGSNVSNTQTEDTSEENDVNNTSNDLANLTASLGNETGDQNAAEADQGIPQMDKDLQDLQATAAQQNIEYQSTPYSLAGQGRGITTGILRGEEAVKQRQVGLDLLVTNSNIAAKQGNITLAQSLADKAVAAKYDPIKASIAAKQALLAQQNTNLSRADQKLANTQSAALTIQSKQIDQQIQNEKDSNAIKQTAIINHAPASVIAAMDKIIAAGGDSSQILTLAQGYMSDPLAQKIEQAQLTKLNQDIQSGNLPAVYTQGANPAADALIASINSGKSKLSDIPASQAALKNYVQQGLALATGSTSSILDITQQSLKELNDMVTNNQGFKDAVGFRGVTSVLPWPLNGLNAPFPGSSAANFGTKALQVVNDVLLPNLNMLHGLGRVTDREFQALSSAITALGLDPKTGTSHLSEGAFKTELNDITTRINDLSNSQTNTTTSSSIIPKGTDGTAYGFPGYISDGTQWVPK